MDKKLLEAKLDTLNKYPNAVSQEKPIAVFIVGQPGAGKSTIINSLENKDQFIFIDADQYRNLYDDVNNLKNKDIYEYLNQSGKVSGKTVEYLIDDFSNQKYNLLIEGTLRNPDVPVHTAELLNNKGYTSNMNVMAVKPEESKLSTIDRYLTLEEQKINIDKDTLARPVDPKIHDTIAKNLPENLKKVAESNQFNTMSIYTRNDGKIFEQTKPDPAELVKTYKAAIKLDRTDKEKSMLADTLKRINFKMDLVYSQKETQPVVDKKEIKRMLRDISNEIDSKDIQR